MIDTKFLNDFILQSSTGDLKTKDLYPSEIEDLKVKVSFGFGVRAHVPWISFLGPGMSTSNGFSPGYLFYKKENILILSYGVSYVVAAEESWPDEMLESSPKVSELIENPKKYGDTHIFKHYKTSVEGKSVSFWSNGKEVGPDILSKDLEAIIRKYKECLDMVVKDSTSSLSRGLFYMEQQLEDFIIENWDQTEFGRKYDLIVEDGDLKSQQYRTPIGRIDILARDKSTKDYVVIELKRNQTSDDTVGQVLRYMGWVEEKFNNAGVKGIIIGAKYDEKLHYALKRAKDVEVFSYEVNFKLNAHKNVGNP